MIIRRIFLNSEEKKSLEKNLPAFMSSVLTKMLLMILSSVIAAVSTDGSSFYLNGSSNVEQYKTVDMKDRLLWKHNISRREVSWMTKKESSEDKSQYEKEECINTDDGDAYTNKDGVWIFPLTDLDESRFASRSNILYAISGETFMVRTWSLNDTTLSIAVKQGDMVRLSASFNADSYEIVEDKKMRLLLKYNIASKEVSFLFDKVDNEDEGQYKIEANCSKSNRDTYANNNGAWIFHLNVLKLDEIKQGNVGENIIILRLNKAASSFPRIYHDDEVLTVLKDTGCDVNSTSHFYGRLKCERDKVENRYRIEIQNVVRADTGLYRVNMDGHDTERCFLNITGQTATTQSNSVSTYSVQGSFPYTASSVSGMGTTAVTQFDTMTIQDNSDGINYSQLSNESLSSTVKSSSSENASNQSNVPDVPVLITLIIVGFIGGIILIICCRRRMKRSITYSLEGGVNKI